MDELGRRPGLGLVGAVQLLATAADPLTVFLAAVTLAVAAVLERLPAW